MAVVIRAKPNKPYPSFPLTPHNNGQWCKKVRGKVHFFGVWDDPDAALSAYHEIAGDLHAGRTPRTVEAPAEHCTVKELVNRYLAYQTGRVEAGQIGARWFEDCRRVLTHFARRIGTDRPAELVTADELLAYRTRLTKRGLGERGGLGVHAMSRALTIIRSVFAWGLSTGLIERLPRWGDSLEKPSAAERRRSKASREREHGKALFTADEIRSLLNEADVVMRAAILLGINGGFGNTDCAALPIAAVDLEAASIEFERPKTAVLRVVPLWPETVEALRALMNTASAPPSGETAAALVFRSESGRPMVRQIVRRAPDGSIRKATYVDRLGDRFDDLLARLKLKRRGLGFYALRHTFRTWADEARDQHAIAVIMGHAIPGMAGQYIEEIGMERLWAVAEHVRLKLDFSCIARHESRLRSDSRENTPDHESCGTSWSTAAARV